MCIHMIIDGEWRTVSVCLDCESDYDDDEFEDVDEEEADE